MTNSTSLQLYTLPLGNTAVSVYEIVNGVSLSFIAMILVSGASCLMAYGLMKAAHFRMSNSSTDAAKENNKVTSSLSPKDVRVVKMVAYVSVMFVLCYLPFLLIFFIRAVVPDVGFMKAQHNLNQTFWAIIYASVTINSASNILVYFRVSSRYRSVFLHTFCGLLRNLRAQDISK